MLNLARMSYLGLLMWPKLKEEEGEVGSDQTAGGYKASKTIKNIMAGLTE